MRVWKQVGVSVAVVGAGLCLWGFYSPEARNVFAAIGLGKTPAGAIEVAASGGPAAGASTGQNAGGARRNGNATLVVTAPVKKGTVNDRLNAIGNGEAIQSVVVMPQASGTLSEIRTSSGARVVKGQVLARLDDEEQVIERDKAQVALRSAVEKSNSYKNLKSVSRLDVLDAQIAEEAAKLALSTAELNLKRRDIVAPIEGVAGIVAANIGDNVTTQSTIVSIDDRSEILVNFWAPERFATAIKVGMPVEATSISRPGETFKGEIEAVDNRVDEASRTIRIRAKFGNEKDELRAGMSFGVTMRFAGETYASVDPLAVQWDAEGSYVWRVTDNKSNKVRVQIVQRNPDAVLVKAELADGEPVVIEGLQRVREGGAVRVGSQPKPEEVASQ
ncbi:MULTISPECIES: efflux RND transporter periplasmic adaptor subunit [Rhizobium/Agrobacterium group]|uniref:efflux RND transporter periplasmic adaptor subunit n=1 Tax=Rhizobium/Agrobacterium group TaxID=227290 RepID=UPI000FD9B3E0|nr:MULTISPECIES: efflux RND transporter periplasmic adaptor subunit [Rhizobium/Agrobacterium group]MBB4402212.1 RND family efflux transporter MFP subunit [Agrobacterium radiobacter]MBB5588366.1 RND family efflux transporter MFP subunit [Agrobacterium radiobacter]RVT74677.1 efflux RND transporter periplasmic adaptor subunit [Agrobacterium sp. CNPSo 2736]TGE89447.1 efflux transporter periplasmic adaptor subunit [Rhizobium sp. SEMIA 4032]TKV76434.1 efflux RND transporter periplasmic adaptor subun